MGMSKHQYHDDIVRESENVDFNYAEEEHNIREAQRLDLIKKALEPTTPSNDRLHDLVRRTMGWRAEDATRTEWNELKLETEPDLMRRQIVVLNYQVERFRILAQELEVSLKNMGEPLEIAEPGDNS